MLYYGGDRRQSIVRENGGKHPIWGQELGFQRTIDTFLRVEVWDKDKYTKDDLIGEGQLNLAPLLMFGTPGPFSQCVELLYKKGKKAGWLNMEVMFQAPPIIGGVPQVGLGISGVGPVGVGAPVHYRKMQGYTQPWTYQPYSTITETVKKTWTPL